MTLSTRATLTRQLDDLQASLPVILASGPIDEQCRHVVNRAAEILHYAGSLDRDYVTDRLTWILARLPPTEPLRGHFDVARLPVHDVVAARRRQASVGAGLAITLA